MRKVTRRGSLLYSLRHAGPSKVSRGERGGAVEGGTAKRKGAKRVAGLLSVLQGLLFPYAILFKVAATLRVRKRTGNSKRNKVLTAIFPSKRHYEEHDSIYSLGERLRDVVVFYIHYGMQVFREHFTRRTRSHGGRENCFTQRR